MLRNSRPWLALAALVAVAVSAFVALRPRANDLPLPPSTVTAALTRIERATPPPPASPPAEQATAFDAPAHANHPPAPPHRSAASATAASPVALNTPLILWAEQFHTATPAARATLLADGVALARSRRATLAALIQTDPEAALAATFPRTLRTGLPESITAELEQLISARAELAVIQSCLHPPGAAHDPSEDFYRSTVIGGREYTVHTFGSRLHDASLPATSLIGIALDGHLAVSPDRYRILDANEPLAAALASPTAASPSAATPATATHPALVVEADGNVTPLPSPDALPAFAAALIAGEENPVILEADSGQGSSTVSGRPTQAWTHGDKTLLVILVDFSDRPGAPINKYDGNAVIDAAYIDNVINGPSGVRAFLQANSFGKSDLLLVPSAEAPAKPDVTAVLRLPSTASAYATAGNNTLLHSDARAAATDAGFDVAAYDRVAVVFSYLGDIPSSKITYGGLGNVIGANLWVNGAFDLRVVGHELGHNYGLRHANLWKPPGSNPVSLAGDNPATPDTDERSIDYGDPFDLMGDGDFFENEFSHWNKSLLQWIPDAAVTLAASSGTYRIYRFDASAANLGLPRALKIVRDTTRDYWIGYRRGLDSAATDNGAYVLWGYNSASVGHLLDLTTPGSNASDAPLALNTTFDDTAAGITLRPVAQGGSDADEWLDLQVTLQPRLAWAASSYVVNEQGGSAVLSVTRSANFTGNVTVAYATAPGTATATTDYTHTTGTLTWLDGDTAAKTISIPLVADSLVEGTETFTVTLSAPTGGVIVDPATTTVTVADPGARDPSFAANFINSTINRALVQPDGTLLIAGWFSSINDSGSTSHAYGRIARIKSTGTFDPDFNPGTGANGTVYALARQPDGKILIGGVFTSVNGTPLNRIARLHPDGALDASFDPGAAADGTVYDLLVQPDEKILVAGSFTTFAGTARNGLVRLFPDGSLDTGFANFTGPVVFSLRRLALQPDGKILVAGSYYFQTGGLRAGLRRVNTDGSIDAAFNGIVQGASKAFDPAFLGAIHAVSVLSDNRILIAGDFSEFNGVARGGIARLSATGALDTTYTPSANDAVNSLLPLPDGAVLIGGEFTTISVASATRIARLTSAGALDTAFAAAGGHAANVQDLALQPDGNVVLAGDFASFQGASPSRPLWRLVPGLAGRPGVLQFATDSVTASEGASATLTVTRTGGTLGALTVGYATVAASATAGTDFTTTTGVVTWATGDATAKTITVPLPLDGTAEGPETFIVNLGAPLLGGTLLGDRQQATVTLSSAFTTWQAANFTPLELENPAISGDTADPDHDGLPNLTEFAFGLAPKTASTTGTPTTALQDVGGSNYLTLTFRRRTPALDLAYTVQTSDDLTVPAGWTANAVAVGAAINNGDGTETVTFRDATPATSSAPRRFLRVQVTRTP